VKCIADPAARRLAPVCAWTHSILSRQFAPCWTRNA